MTSPTLDAIAALNELHRYIDEATSELQRENQSLSHHGYAARIETAKAITHHLSHLFAEALHEVAGTAIGHDFIDADYADIIRSKLFEAIEEEYGPAWTHQDERAYWARRERSAVSA